jgi:hypothetical protein
MGITMDRRSIIVALACWPFARLHAEEDASRPRYKISAGQLHKALATRFPMRFGSEGLLAIEISAPSLHLLPARNMLGAGLLAEIKGVQMRQPQWAELDLGFALRYEPADQTIRAHQPELLALQRKGLPPDAQDLFKAMLPVMAREAVGEVVLHRFSASELALADTMGFEPEKLTVVEDGLVLSFAPKQGR